MLEGLSKINWNKIRHRNGAASNIPKLILQLVSKDNKTQKPAINQLFNDLWFHGMVYEATARAVPSLYEVLESSTCSERFSVLWFLSAIATGSFRRNDLQEDHPEVIWNQNAIQAVRQGIPKVLELLNDSDKDLRLPAILLLVSLRGEADQMKPALLKVFSREVNPTVRAGLGLALAMLGDYHAEAFDLSVEKSLSLAKSLAKACSENRKMSGFSFKTIEECFAESLTSRNQDWLRDERVLLNNSNFDGSYF
ncbi:MAG TPA: HEAT repeat domain-containing protein [bacterium]|jgi:hypothetical protein|nr:HEAT repeat domain-containing protein [bacterium]